MTSRSGRSISHSEVDTALTCQARHAFGYTGHLTGGTTLRPKATAPILREGRAWGAAVARWHAQRGELLDRLDAHEALIESLEQDADDMASNGAPVDPAALVSMGERLGLILDHYMGTTYQLPNLTRLEGELDVPLLSRSGRGSSSLYRFQGFLDGFMTDAQGREWLVEFKLRSTLTPRQVLDKQRQYRWYAWARQREVGHPIVGIIVDERLNEPPKPARIVHAGKRGKFTVSHAKDQMTTSALYCEACEKYDVEPQPDVIEHLDARVWGWQPRIIFRPGELDEAGRELVSAAKLIRSLDSGELYPIRNAKPANCRPCRFKAICENPGDDFYIDTIFNRGQPKRLLPKREAGGRSSETGQSPAREPTTPPQQEAA